MQAVSTRPDTLDKITDNTYKTENQGNQAVSVKNEELVIVFVVNDNKAELREVKTGIQDDNFIEIISGLELCLLYTSRCV